MSEQSPSPKGLVPRLEPATAEEIDHIVAGLLEDEGPPLLVQMDSGQVWEAGSRLPSRHYAPQLQARANNAEALAKAWEGEESVAAVQARSAWAQEYKAKLAGDVFHPGEERSTLLESINQALRDWDAAERTRRARAAIRKAVHPRPKGEEGAPSEGAPSDE